MDRALWFVGPNQVELRPADLPPLGCDDARVRTICSGLSAGTEMLAYRGELPDDLQIDETIGSLGDTFTYPFRYGYSCVGVIEALGQNVENFCVGDVVFAFHPHQERFVTGSSDLIQVAGLEPRLATLLPYVETALQITLDAGHVFGETVVVSGLGALGLLVSLLVGRAGGRVVGVEPQPWRRAVAAELGLTAVAPDQAVEALGASDVSLVIECSGNPAALTLALDVLAHEGVVLVASWYGSKPVSLPLGGRFHRRRLTIRSTQVSTIPASLSNRWSHRRRVTHAVDLAATLPLAALATDTIPFGRAAEGYERVARGDQGLIHMAFGYG